MSLEQLMAACQSCLSNTIELMSPSAASNTVRFAAGSAREPKSAVWRAHAHKDDVYIGVSSPNMMSTFKMSLHAKVWTAAFTAESGVVMSDSRNRRTDRWERPHEFRPGWTNGPLIAVPFIPDGLGARPERLRIGRKEIYWADAALAGEALVFAFYFVRPGFDSADWLTQIHATAGYVGALALADGQSVRVVAWREPMAATFKEGIEGLLGDPQYRMKVDAKRDPEQGGSLLWLSTQNQRPCITDLPIPMDFGEADLSSQPLRISMGYGRVLPPPES